MEEPQFQIHGECVLAMKRVFLITVQALLLFCVCIYNKATQQDFVPMNFIVYPMENSFYFKCAFIQANSKTSFGDFVFQCIKIKVMQTQGSKKNSQPDTLNRLVMKHACFIEKLTHKGKFYSQERWLYFPLLRGKQIVEFCRLPAPTKNSLFMTLSDYINLNSL